MLLSEMAAMRNWSKARVKNVANAEAKTTLRSRAAQPTATLTWKKTQYYSEQFILYKHTASSQPDVSLDILLELYLFNNERL